MQNRGHSTKQKSVRTQPITPDEMMKVNELIDTRYLVNMIDEMTKMQGCKNGERRKLGVIKTIITKKFVSEPRTIQSFFTDKVPPEWDCVENSCVFLLLMNEENIKTVEYLFARDFYMKLITEEALNRLCYSANKSEATTLGMNLIYHVGFNPYLRKQLLKYPEIIRAINPQPVTELQKQDYITYMEYLFQTKEGKEIVRMNDKFMTLLPEQMRDELNRSVILVDETDDAYKKLYVEVLSKSNKNSDNIFQIYFLLKEYQEKCDNNVQLIIDNIFEFFYDMGDISLLTSTLRDVLNVEFENLRGAIKTTLTGPLLFNYAMIVFMFKHPVLLNLIEFETFNKQYRFFDRVDEKEVVGTAAISIILNLAYYPELAADLLKHPKMIESWELDPLDENVMEASKLIFTSKTGEKFYQFANFLQTTVIYKVLTKQLIDSAFTFMISEFKQDKKDFKWTVQFKAASPLLLQKLVALIKTHGNSHKTQLFHLAEIKKNVSERNYQFAVTAKEVHFEQLFSNTLKFDQAFQATFPKVEKSVVKKDELVVLPPSKSLVPVILTPDEEIRFSKNLSGIVCGAPEFLAAIRWDESVAIFTIPDNAEWTIREEKKAKTRVKTNSISRTLLNQIIFKSLLKGNLIPNDVVKIEAIDEKGNVMKYHDAITHLRFTPYEHELGYPFKLHSSIYSRFLQRGLISVDEVNHAETVINVTPPDLIDTTPKVEAESLQYTHELMRAFLSSISADFMDQSYQFLQSHTEKRHELCSLEFNHSRTPILTNKAGCFFDSKAILNQLMMAINQICPQSIKVIPLDTDLILYVANSNKYAYQSLLANRDLIKQQFNKNTKKLESLVVNHDESENKPRIIQPLIIQKDDSKSTLLHHLTITNLDKRNILFHCESIIKLTVPIDKNNFIENLLFEAQFVLHATRLLQRFIELLVYASKNTESELLNGLRNGCLRHAYNEFYSEDVIPLITEFATIISTTAAIHAQQHALTYFQDANTPLNIDVPKSWVDRLQELLKPVKCDINQLKLGELTKEERDKTAENCRHLIKGYDAKAPLNDDDLIKYASLHSVLGGEHGSYVSRQYYRYIGHQGFDKPFLTYLREIYNELQQHDSNCDQSLYNRSLCPNR